MLAIPMFAQRNLSAQIVGGCGDCGDYLWKAKESQSDLLNDIHTLFEPPPQTKNEAANFVLPSDLEWASSVNKRAWTSGGTEERQIWVSSALCGYSEWPHLEQVFKLQVPGGRWVRADKGDGALWSDQLPRTIASPHRLLRVVRGHWGIEKRKRTGCTIAKI